MSATFKRSSGTAGIRGQLYETKLISLILYRAKHDDSIEQFQLASNMDSKEVGAFDDICFKAKVKGLSKPLIAFIQSKHKDDSEDSPKVVLMKYFLSYLKIREQFKSQHDPSSMFHGEFQDTECYFVIYTNGKEQHSLDDDAVENEDDLAKLNELIATGGIAKRPYKHKYDVAASLYENLAKDKTISLAKRLVTFIGKEMSFQDLLSDQNNIILLYHIFLGQKVFEVSEIKPEGHRIATFRKDFFNTRDEYLILFKHTLFQKIFNGRKTMKKPNEINNLLSKFRAERTDVRLSRLIGTVVIYNKGQLKLVEEYSKHFNNKMLKVLSKQPTVNKAVKLAAEDIMTKVPAAFGNKDLTLRGSDAKKERRLKHLKSKIIDILDKFKPNNLIVIDESIQEGLLEVNGGLAGAIGNIFVPDDNTKYMKITDSCESLGPLAKSLYTKLVNEIHNLYEYRFYFDVKNVFRFSLGPSDYDKSLAKEFADNFLFYCQQAKENEVQELLKSKIENCQLGHQNYFQAKTDAMCLQYHDRIQKWWMLRQAPYLTKDSNIFEEAINSILKDPLMSSINLLYMSKLQHFEYTFHEDAATSWHLQDHSTTVIITKNCVLTVVKVLQHFKNKDHAVFDLEYIVKLPFNDRNALCAELKKTKDHKALIFVCDTLQNKSKEIKTLEIIGKAVLNKKTIILTNQMTHETLQQYFPRAVNIVEDDKNSLIEMSEASQKSILESTVVFQGAQLKLDLILDDESKAYVNGDVLNTIISKKSIRTISKLTVDRQYDEIKHLYVDRCVQKKNSIAEIPLKTLFDIKDDVVLLTAEPGMGKSTLLTHLSIETKIKHPDVWIVRVNLLEYSREFSKWKQDNTAINTLETIKFVCQVMLAEKLDGKGNNVEFELEEDNGVVNLTQCTGDQWTEFELKLFLHFYKKGNTMFIFDGFDEICPLYKDEVIKCIKTVNSHNKKHKIWVTSRPYTEIVKCLQQSFGEPYQILHLAYPAKKDYLTKIWKSNLILKELDKLQLQNIYEFIQFLNEAGVQQLKACQSLLDIYVNAANYIVDEIRNTSIPLWTFNDNYDDIIKDYKEIEKNIFELATIYEYGSENNPLTIFLQAHFFINRIKDVSRSTNTWDQDVHMFTFYEQYSEMILKRRFQGKNKMDIYNPDIRNAYIKELADFIAKHKKMAAYNIFNQNINKLFSKKDVKEIEENIKLVEKGVEKTGLIYSVAKIMAIKIPIFIHKTFAEYFAVEYICDLLKYIDESENQHQLMDSIFDVIFSAFDLQNIRNIFDCKMKIDEKLMSVIKNHEKVIFKWVLEQGHALIISEQSWYWPPLQAVIEGLHNLKSLFVVIFERHINQNNLDKFLDIARQTHLLSNAVIENWDDLVVCVLNKVKNYDVSILNRVLRENFRHLSRSRNYDEMSSEEIVRLIRKVFLQDYNTPFIEW